MSMQPPPIMLMRIVQTSYNGTLRIPSIYPLSYNLLTSSSRTPNPPITPRTRMPTRPQQRPCFIQRISPTSPDRYTLARTRLSPVAHGACAPRRIRRRLRSTHTRRRSHTNRRRPPPHPSTYASPMEMSTLQLAVVIDCDDYLLVARIERATARCGFAVAKVPEL